MDLIFSFNPVINTYISYPALAYAESECEKLAISLQYVTSSIVTRTFLFAFLRIFSIKSIASFSFEAISSAFSIETPSPNTDKSNLAFTNNAFKTGIRYNPLASESNILPSGFSISTVIQSSFSFILFEISAIITVFPQPRTPVKKCPLNAGTFFVRSFIISVVRFCLVIY